MEEYLFNEYARNNYFPTYDDVNDEVMDLSKKEYNQAVYQVRKALHNIHNEKDSIYDGYLQLHDNHAIFKLDNPDRDDSAFYFLVDSALEQFESVTGERPYLLGRSNRHFCVELNYENAKNYEELKKVALELEQWAIDEFNHDESQDDYNESFNRKHRVLRESTGLKKYTQKQLKDLVRSGKATDITTAGQSTIDEVRSRCYKVGISHGINGMNGGLLADPKTGEQYVITARNTNLFRLF